MAYIVGVVTPEEAAALERRGWELEPAPAALVPAGEDPGRYRMAFVDVSMFEVMSGPDWDADEG